MKLDATYCTPFTLPVFSTYARVAALLRVAVLGNCPPLDAGLPMGLRRVRFRGLMPKREIEFDADYQKIKFSVIELRSDP